MNPFARTLTLGLALATAACQGPPLVAPAAAPRVQRERIDAALEPLVRSGALVGVSALVYEGGREVYFGAFGQADREAGRPMGRDALVQIFSMTKPLTGVALMTLYEQGRFGLDDPLAQHAPEFAALKVYAGTDAAGQPVYETPRRPPTVRDLLRHTAGFQAGPEDTPVGRLFRAADPMSLNHTLPQMAQQLAGVPLLFHPGTRWVYGPSVDVQAYLVERLSGQPFERYLQEQVLKPLGMTHTRHLVNPGDADRAQLAAMYLRADDGRLTREPDASALNFNTRPWPMRPGGWGLVSTLDDTMRFARMLLAGGTLDGVRVLRPETVRLMATDALPPESRADLSWLPGKGRVGFGIDFAVRVAPPADAQEASGAVGEFFWDGLANTLFWVDPQNQIAAVLFTQFKPFGGVPLHKAFRDAVYAGVPGAAAPRP